jgi:hypothetical protein
MELGTLAMATLRQLSEYDAGLGLVLNTPD